MYELIREVILIRLLPPYLLGIIMAVFIQNDFLSKIIAGGFGLVFFVFIIYQLFYKKQYSQRWINGVFIIINGFCLGYLITIIHTDTNFKNHYTNYYSQEKNVIIQLSVDEAPVQKKNSKKFIAKIQNIDSKAVTGNLLCYVEDSLGENLSYGDELILQIKPKELSRPLNPAQFDFAHFMRFRQIYHQVYFTKDQILSIEHNIPKYSIFYWSYMLREKLSNLIKGVIQDEQAFEVAASLLLGFREKLDNETIKAYSASGAMHVLAVSGLHVGIFYWILNHIFFFLNGTRRSRVFKILLLILIIWGYAFVTGLSPSIQRAALMFSLVGVAQNIKRSSGIYNSIVVSAFILLCFNPYLLMEVGFQLSYAALIGIIIFQPILYRQLYIENKVLDWIWEISCVSIAAQLATFPIGLLYFHQFPVYFLVSNLVVIPAAMILLPFGLLYFSIATIEQSFEINFLSKLVGEILGKSFELLNYLVFSIEQLPGSLLIGFSPTIFETWLSYALIISFLLFYHYKKKLFLFSSLLSILLLLVIYNVNSLNDLKREAITFYAIRNATAIDVNHFQKQYFLADTALMNDNDQMLFSIVHNWWQKGHIVNDAVVGLDSCKHTVEDGLYFNYPLLQVGNTQLMILDAEKTISHQETLILKTKPDLILLKNNPYFVLNQLDKFSSNSTVLIDGSNSYYFLTALKKVTNKLNLKTHFLMEEGAFVYEL